MSAAGFIRGRRDFVRASMAKSGDHQKGKCVPSYSRLRMNQLFSHCAADVALQHASRVGCALWNELIFDPKSVYAIFDFLTHDNLVRPLPGVAI